MTTYYRGLRIIQIKDKLKVLGRYEAHFNNIKDMETMKSQIDKFWERRYKQ